MKTIVRKLRALGELFLGFAANKSSRGGRVARVSVTASGEIFLDGRETTVAALQSAFERLKTQRATVWYYRESGKGAPPAQAIEVFKLMVEKQLPISLSTKPDFSDYVDEKGSSHPRR